MTKPGETSERRQNERKSEGQNGVQNKKTMKKSVERLGGRGNLSLERFANAKTRDVNYNPAYIKKQREFYRNAKYVNKYKKSLKQQEEQNSQSPLEHENENKEENKHIHKHNKKKAWSLQQLYEKKHGEEEKARMEREAIIQAKNEEIQQSLSHRKNLKEKMYKKTRKGQPVMKFRIEHLLETIKASTS